MTLISGTTSTDGFFKQFAYAELEHLASDESGPARSRREALFADQKYNPNMWASLCRESLLTLGKDYQLFLRRGQPAPAGKSTSSITLPSPNSALPAAPTPAPPKPTTPLPAKPTQLLRAPILKGAPASPLRAALDTLASDGPLSTAVAATADGAVSHLPELFRSVRPAARAAEVVHKGEARVAGLLERTLARWRRRLRSAVPDAPFAAVGALREWWTRERVNRKVEMCLPNRRLDALVIAGACALSVVWVGLTRGWGQCCVILCAGRWRRTGMVSCSGISPGSSRRCSRS